MKRSKTAPKVLILTAMIFALLGSTSSFAVGRTTPCESFTNGACATAANVSRFCLHASASCAVLAVEAMNQVAQGSEEDPAGLYHNPGNAVMDAVVQTIVERAVGMVPRAAEIVTDRLIRNFSGQQIQNNVPVVQIHSRAAT